MKEIKIDNQLYVSIPKTTIYSEAIKLVKNKYGKNFIVVTMSDRISMNTGEPQNDMPFNDNDNYYFYINNGL